MEPAKGPLQSVEIARFLCAGALICLTPLLVVARATEQYVAPKYEWIAIATGLLVLLSAVRVALGAPVRLPIGAGVALAVAWTAWNVVSIAWADSRSLAWDDARQWITLLLAAILIHDTIGGDRRRLIRLAWGLVVSAALTAVWTLRQDFVQAFGDTGGMVSKLPDWRGYLAAGFGNTGHIADFLALTFVTVLMLYCYARSQLALVVSGATLVLSAAAMIVCWSVHSNGGLIIAAIVVAIAITRRYGAEWWRRRARRLIVLGVLFGVVVGFYMIDHGANPHAPSIWTEAFGSDRWLEGGSTRLVIWKPALVMAMEHRFVGVGAGNFPYAFPSIILEDLANDPDLGRYVGGYTNAAHNALLQSWCELGVIGAVLLVAMFAVAFLALTRRRYEGSPATVAIRLSLLGFLVAFVIHAQMNLNLQLPVTSLLLLLVVLLCESMRDRGEETLEGPLTVENESGPFTLELSTFGMKRISAIGVMASQRSGSLIAIGVGVMICFLLSVGSACRLRSDYHYHLARHATTITKKELEFERALSINPRHHDCRSRYTSFLLQRGEFSRALKHLAIVMERLDAPELYARRAKCADGIGDTDLALGDWLSFYERQPYLARTLRLEHYNAILQDARQRGLLEQ